MQACVKSSKNQYGKLGLIKFCTNAFAIPARFGKFTPCPFCKEQGHIRNFSVAHITVCNSCAHFCHNLLSEQEGDIINDICNRDYSIYFLKCTAALSFLRGKKRDAVIQCFSVLSRLLGFFSAQPDCSPDQLYSTLSQHSARRYL